MSVLTRETLNGMHHRQAGAETLPWVRIGMSTCGLAAGAQAAYDAMTSYVSQHGIACEVRKCGCAGMCYAEPLVEVGVPGLASVTYGRVDATLAERIIDMHVAQHKIISENVVVPSPHEVRIVLQNCGKIDPDSIDEYIAAGGYAGLSKALFEMSPDKVIEEITASGLRGRGGAGFPTGLKWSLARKSPGNEKYVICNGDEGDPGAYMDRSVLESDPHAVIEGMLIAGYAIGATHGIVYIRAEYPLAIRRIRNAIEQACAYGLAGSRILGSLFTFDIEIRLGAGAFVCGEETALIASIEGRRGNPVPRPPFPTERGLWEMPTNINNVETLACVGRIISRGAPWFASIGTEKSKGTKVFAITGKTAKSGLVEIPMGISLREIIFDISGGSISGKNILGVQTGGPSGGMIPRECFDTPVSFEHLQQLGSIMGSGGMIVLDEDDCVVDLARFYLGFCVDESCGKCAPCRIGGTQMHRLLSAIAAGKGTMDDLVKLEAIARTMQKASLCGLGQSAPNPVISSLKYFRSMYIEHVEKKKCRAKKCSGCISYTIIQSACKRCGLCFRNCPVNAISGDRQSGYRINAAVCIKCGKCFEVCKFDAVEKE